MSQNENEIHAALQALQQRIDEIDTDDPERQHVLDDVSRKIDQIVESDDSHETLMESINEAITHFEADHPALTTALQQAMTILSVGGI